MYGNIVCNIYIYIYCIYIYIYIRGIYDRSIIEPLSTSTGYIIGTDTPGTEIMDNICFSSRSQGKLPNSRIYLTNHHSCQSIESMFISSMLVPSVLFLMYCCNDFLLFINPYWNSYGHYCLFHHSYGKSCFVFFFFNGKSTD